MPTSQQSSIVAIPSSKIWLCHSFTDRMLRIDQIHIHQTLHLSNSQNPHKIHNFVSLRKPWSSIREEQEWGKWAYKWTIEHIKSFHPRLCALQPVRILIRVCNTYHRVTFLNFLYKWRSENIFLKRSIWLNNLLKHFIWGNFWIQCLLSIYISNYFIFQSAAMERGISKCHDIIRGCIGGFEPALVQVGSLFWCFFFSATFSYCLQSRTQLCLASCWRMELSPPFGLWWVEQ